MQRCVRQDTRKSLKRSLPHHSRFMLGWRSRVVCRSACRVRPFYENSLQASSNKSDLNHPTMVFQRKHLHRCARRPATKAWRAFLGCRQSNDGEAERTNYALSIAAVSLDDTYKPDLPAGLARSISDQHPVPTRTQGCQSLVAPEPTASAASRDKA
jgi:hypothetical protein